jgi:hypothetical protein
MRAHWLGLSALLVCRALAAQPLAGPTEGQATNDANSEARAHFEAGLTAVRQGELVEALREFEAAYAALPNYSVLFNIGQAQAALGRSVQAVSSFERYLEQGGSQLSESRRREVEQLVAQNRKLTGALRLNVHSPATVRIWLNGELLSLTEIAEPRAMTVGAHTLLYSHGEGFPTELAVRVEPERTTVVEITPAAGGTEPAPNRRAQEGKLEVTCSLAGLGVEVAGRALGPTPLAGPVSAPLGKLRIAFTRTDYLPVLHDVWVAADRTTRVPCSLPLSPTRSSLERSRAIARRTVLGYSLAGAGVTALAAGAIVLGWNHGRYQDFRRTRSPTNPLVERAVSIQRADDAAVGLFILGAGVSAAATWLLLDTP